jgi:ribosomal protein S18 acetylase RimI-like enzyme
VAVKQSKMSFYDSDSVVQSTFETKSSSSVQNSSEESSANNPKEYTDLTISDFCPQTTRNESQIGVLNQFFNSSTIKQELHWFTHRDTLERAFKRDDRELFYIQLQERIVAATMVWCESRVLGNQQAQIRLIATAKEFRGNGFGRMLVEECLSFAAFRNKDEIIADVAEDSPATDFWIACEFEVKNTYETDGGRVMNRMIRKI